MFLMNDRQVWSSNGLSLLLFLKFSSNVLVNECEFLNNWKISANFFLYHPLLFKIGTKEAIGSYSCLGLWTVSYSGLVNAPCHLLFSVQVALLVTWMVFVKVPESVKGCCIHGKVWRRAQALGQLMKKGSCRSTCLVPEGPGNAHGDSSNFLAGSCKADVSLWWWSVNVYNLAESTQPVLVDWRKSWLSLFLRLTALGSKLSDDAKQRSTAGQECSWDTKLMVLISCSVWIR